MSATHYRLLPEAGRKLRAANLTAAEWRIWSYFSEADPFGDSYRKLPDLLDIMSECGVSKPTFYRAIAKFEESELFDFQGEFKFRNLLGFKAAVSNLRIQSQFCDEILNSENPVSNLRIQSQFCNSDIDIERARHTSSDFIQTIPDSLTQEAREGENLASPSEPEEVSATPPVEKQVPVNSIPAEAKHVAEDHTSAAAPPPNFSNFSDPVGDRFAQGLPPWKAPDGTINPEFLEWVAKGHDPKTSVMPRKSWAKSVLRNSPERAHDLWSEYQELQAQVRSPLAQAEPLVSPTSNPFGAPTSTDEEAERIQGMAIAAKAAGRPLSPVILKRAQELGIDLMNVAIATPAPSVSPIGEIPPIPPQPVQVAQSAQPAIAPEIPEAKPQSFADLASMFGKLGLPAPSSTPPEIGVIDASEILAQIDLRRGLLGWSQAKLDELVEAEFGRRSTRHLDDDELEGLLSMLKTQQPVGGAA
ncbi:hypothetical protein NDA01_21775 [Trichocoleus desertorum AS-A10]|uniref:hypothetical protein n=1 Tax=Trichocoleus desertorum TaxID=1481672 RepID=UPI003298B36A